MSKKTMIYCDICGRDISHEDIRFKFKCYGNNYVNWNDFEFSKWSKSDFSKWSKADICKDCYIKFLEFVYSKGES